MLDDRLVALSEVGHRRFCRLESLRFHRRPDDEGRAESWLVLRLTSEADPSAALELSFEGVADLRVGDLNGIMWWELSIRSVSSHQLEGLRYRVVEEEHRLLSFLCRNCEFRVECGS